MAVYRRVGLIHNYQGEIMPEQENELRFTIYISSYGNKAKCVRDVGRTLCRILQTAFGDRVRVMDHRSKPVQFDPDAHDFGMGEA